MHIGFSLAIYTNTIGSRPTYWGSQYVSENLFDFFEFALIQKNLLHAVLFFSFTLYVSICMRFIFATTLCKENLASVIVNIGSC